MGEIKFDERVAIVTGGGRGLGRTYARELARRGASVVVNDLGAESNGDGSSTNAADAVVAEIEQEGGTAIASYDSVASVEGGAAIVQRALDEFGTVDIVVNNAGSLRDRAFVNLSHEEICSILDVHLVGAFNVTQPAFRAMKQKGYGRILFTSSSAGLFGNFGQANYAAAKMGLVGLSNTLAIEGAKYGINVNAIAPIAKSRLTSDILGPLGDHLEPELVTPLAIFLVSEVSDVSHKIFSVCGGRYASVFVGVTPGWIAERGISPTPEDIGGSLDRILDETDYIVPSCSADELELVARAVGR